jgi:hypothetical protein
METETKSISYISRKIGKNPLIKECVKEKNKKRVETENWTFASQDYTYENQVNNIKKIIENGYKFIDEISNNIRLKNI